MIETCLSRPAESGRRAWWADNGAGTAGPIKRRDPRRGAFGRDRKERRKVANKKQPNPIDIHVGSRVRLRRMMLSMSQEKLGESSRDNLPADLERRERHQPRRREPPAAHCDGSSPSLSRSFSRMRPARRAPPATGRDPPAELRRRLPVDLGRHPAEQGFCPHQGHPPRRRIIDLVALQPAKRTPH